MANLSGSATLSREDLEMEMAEETQVSPASETSAEPTATEPNETPGATESATAQRDDSDLPELTEDQFARLLHNADPKWLARHPKVAGLTGDLANRRAQTLSQQREAALREQIQAEMAERFEQQRMEQMLEQDPEAYRETYFERQRAAQERAEAERSQLSQLGDYDKYVLESKLRNAPPEVAQQFYGKHYPGNPLEARQRFMQELDAAVIEHTRAQIRAELETSVVPAVRKDALSFRNTQGRSSVSGNRAPGRTFSAEEVRNMSLKDFEANEDTILGQIPGKKR